MPTAIQENLSEPQAETRRSAGHWWILGSAFALLLAVGVLRWYASPDERGVGTHEQLGLPPCTMYKATGVPCPGCGVTTSVTLAAHGRFGESFLNQPFGLLVAFSIPAWVLWALVGHVRGRDLSERLGRVGLWPSGVVIGALMLAAWVYKIIVM